MICPVRHPARPSSSLNEALGRLGDAMATSRTERNALWWAIQSRDRFIARYGSHPADPGHAAVLADLDRRVAELEGRS